MHEKAYEADLVVSAAAREAEEKLRREKSQTALNSLPTSKEQAPRTARKAKKGATSQGATDKLPPPPKARVLVDPATLVMQDTAGELIAGTPRGDGDAGPSGGSGSAGSGKPKLNDPNRESRSSRAAAVEGHSTTRLRSARTRGWSFFVWSSLAPTAH